MRFRWFLLVSQLSVSAALASDLSGGLTLQQAVSIALQRNRDLQFATTTIAQARAGILSADAAPNPTLAISTGSINLSGTNGSGSLWRKEIDKIGRAHV